MRLSVRFPPDSAHLLSELGCQGGFLKNWSVLLAQWGRYRTWTPPFGLPIWTPSGPPSGPPYEPHLDPHMDPHTRQLVLTFRGLKLFSKVWIVFFKQMFRSSVGRRKTNCFQLCLVFWFLSDKSTLTEYRAKVSSSQVTDHVCWFVSDLSSFGSLILIHCSQILSCVQLTLLPSVFVALDQFVKTAQ